LLNFYRFFSGFFQNAAIFTFSIFQRCKFESSRYGESSKTQKSLKFKFNPHPFLQPREAQRARCVPSRNCNRIFYKGPLLRDQATHVHTTTPAPRRRRSSSLGGETFALRWLLADPGWKRRHDGPRRSRPSRHLSNLLRLRFFRLLLQGFARGNFFSRVSLLFNSGRFGV